MFFTKRTSCVQKGRNGVLAAGEAGGRAIVVLCGVESAIALQGRFGAANSFENKLRARAAHVVVILLLHYEFYALRRRRGRHSLWDVESLGIGASVVTERMDIFGDPVVKTKKTVSILRRNTCRGTLFHSDNNKNNKETRRSKICKYETSAFFDTAHLLHGTLVSVGRSRPPSHLVPSFHPCTTIR